MEFRRPCSRDRRIWRRQLCLPRPPSVRASADLRRLEWRPAGRDPRQGRSWIARAAPGWVAEFSLAGALSSVMPLGTWWAAVHRDRWPDHDSARDYMKTHWSEPWGDRRQEIVFIGAGIDWPAIKARLDACLPPDRAYVDADPLPDLPDPFQSLAPARKAGMSGNLGQTPLRRRRRAALPRTHGGGRGGRRGLPDERAGTRHRHAIWREPDRGGGG